MASFTDTNIPKFNPYVQQLPVEAMVQVGMSKQKQYEEGVTKIQTQINNIAGMDVMRDVDKNYLQSKINQLGNDLTTVAAGDFSNFQLVNSVGGMATQISKDKYVQNAVGSAARYRKEAALMEKARAEGKSSQANIYDFGTKANAWLESDKLDESFNGRYTQYIDVKKKAMEAIKQLHPNLTQYDIPFEVKDGKVNTAKIADAMQRYKIEGIDENQIKQAINASFSPDDINQLSIDAKYQFRDVTPDQLVNLATSNYNFQKTDAKKSLDLLIKQRGTITDPTSLSEINKYIEQYEVFLGKDGKPGKVDEEYLENLKNATDNPDGVKLSIYKDGFIKEFANGFTWKTQVEELMTNPIKQQMNWLAEMNHKQQVFNQSVYEFQENLKRDDAKIQLDAEANALKRAELYGVASPWTTVGNPTDNILRSAEMFTNHSNSVAQNYEAGKNALLATGKFSVEQINKMVNDPNTPIPAVAITTIQEMRRQKNYLSSLETFEKNIRASSDKEAGVYEAKKQLTAGKKPLSLTVGNQNFTLSPEEMLVLEAATTTKSRGSKQGTISEVIVDRTGLNKNQLNFVNAMQGILYGKFEPGQQQPKLKNEVLRQINPILSQYVKPAQQLKVALDKSNVIYRNKLAPLVSNFVPQIKALGAEKDGSPTAITINKVSALLTATAARNVAADEIFSLSTSSEMLSNKNSKDTRIFVQQDGDNYTIIMKSEANPSKLQKIRVSKGEILANFGNEYVNNLTQESARIAMGRGNTNLVANPNSSVMQKSFGDFPGIRKMDVKADFTQDVSNPELFVPGINILKKDGRYQYFELSGIDNLSRVGYEQGRKNLNALTDNVLLKSIKQEYPNYDYSQLAIKQ
jgi:hypothetical protein